jgi:class 3 adenylate cyclase
MSEPGSSGLRRRLSLTLVGVALVSVLLLSVVNYLFARMLIGDSVEAQLVSVRDTRVEALQNGFERVVFQTSTLAANPDVVTALQDLAGEYGRLRDDISADQVAELEAIYDREVLPPFIEAGAAISAADLVPDGAAGRYLQQWYIAENPNGFDERDLLDDAGDGSGYSAAHARHHPVLRDLMVSAGASDLLFVDAQTTRVVYSVKKRIDLGTDALTWPPVGEELGTVDGVGPALEQLSGVAVGDAIVSDMVFYIPTRGDPVLFAAAAVRSGPDVVGAIVAQMPVEVVNDVITAGGDWDLLGLGETGEAYIVGADRAFRSESRAWVEDPAEYLGRLAESTGDQGTAELIGTVGSPVMIQRLANESVDTALNGNEYVGTVQNYLGSQVLSASAPVEVRGLDWVVVVEQNVSESNSALDAMVRSILVVLLILLPLIAVIGSLLARILTRPVQRLVHAAARIAAGDLETRVGDLGRNELGDLGDQLEGVASQLKAKEQAIVDEEQKIADMLGAAVPGRLVDRVRRGEDGIEDVFDTATVISILVDGIPEAAGADHDLALEVGDRLNEAVGPMLERFGVERVQRSSGSQLFLTGLEQPGPRTDDAARFALTAIETIAAIGAELGLTLTARAGLSAGDLATGVLGSGQLSFGVWGDPPDMAVMLASLAGPGQALVDPGVVEELGGDWDVGPLEQLPGLTDDIEAHAISGPRGASPASASSGRSRTPTPHPDPTP